MGMTKGGWGRWGRAGRAGRVDGRDGGMEDGRGARSAHPRWAATSGRGRRRGEVHGGEQRGRRCVRSRMGSGEPGRSAGRGDGGGGGRQRTIDADQDETINHVIVTATSLRVSGLGDPRRWFVLRARPVAVRVPAARARVCVAQWLGKALVRTFFPFWPRCGGARRMDGWDGLGRGWIGGWSRMEGGAVRGWARG